jgi:hypothetical protein
LGQITSPAQSKRASIDSVAAELGRWASSEVSLMVRWSRLTLFLGLTLTIGSPRSVSGQATHRWSTDATFGAAVVEGTEFFDNGKAAAHLAIADRVLQGQRFATYLEAAYDWFGRFGLLGSNPDLVCIADRAGRGCKPDFPDVTGDS